MSSASQRFRWSMSALIPALMDSFLKRHGESPRRKLAVTRRLTELSREIGRRHSTLCSVLWLAETRGEPEPSRGLGEEWSVCRERTSGSRGEVCLPPRIRFYTDGTDDDGGSVAIRDWGSSDRLQVTARPLISVWTLFWPNTSNPIF